MLTWEDECWFSRFAQPTMNAWTLDGKSQALLQQDKSKDDLEPKKRRKRVLVVIWDKATWHKSEQVRAWVKDYNHNVKLKGGVRLLTWLLPTKSPWLNPQEPHWMHCKRHVVEPNGILSQRQLKERVRDYFDSDAPID